MFENLIEFDR